MQRALRCALALTALSRAEDYAYDSYAYEDAAPVTTSLGGAFVNPGSSVICPSDCRSRAAARIGTLDSDSISEHSRT